jgi:hypothetical protein
MGIDSTTTFSEELSHRVTKEHRSSDLPPISKGCYRVKASDGHLHDIPVENIGKARKIDPKLVILNRYDFRGIAMQFLAGLGIETESAEVTVTNPDGIVKLLQQYGIPVTRENYLRLAFAGNPPEEPLDGEIEAELPEELQRVCADGVNNAPSAGQCDEPSHTTRSGIPICERCGKSTRSMNQLVCAPCRSRTRLLLTKADRKWLRQIGVER